MEPPKTGTSSVSMAGLSTGAKTVEKADVSTGVRNTSAKIVARGIATMDDGSIFARTAA
jgi:hypothetical protein